MKSRTHPGNGGLVIARKIGQGIYVGRDILITVTEMQGGQVKLHFFAPSDVQISRDDFTFESHLMRQQKRDAESA